MDELRMFALLETWTCYGQWLPGDPRGYVSNTLTEEGYRTKRNQPGTAYDRDERATHRRAKTLQKHPTTWLTAELATKDGWIAKEQTAHQELLRVHDGTVEELKAANGWAQTVNANLKVAHARIEELQEEIEKQQRLGREAVAGYEAEIARIEEEKAGAIAWGQAKEEEWSGALAAARAPLRRSCRRRAPSSTRASGAASWRASGTASTCGRAALQAPASASAISAYARATHRYFSITSCSARRRTTGAATTFFTLTLPPATVVASLAWPSVSSILPRLLQYARVSVGLCVCL